ncbi:hypothetical protein [Halorhabdus amylolytica]|uniref:hypothetical protein n=1 Tax=Halorhabdus amylolytica TaxID=2559573 RepID=UPI0010AA5968|nr:hypothetical protein [Halorhabdus amylolytica]
MSVDSADVDAPGREWTLACPTQSKREPQPVDVDDPRVTADRLCDHCLPDGEIPEDVETLLKIGRYDKGIHLPLSYDGERCNFGPYDDYVSYKQLLEEMTVEEFDRRLENGGSA